MPKTFFQTELKKWYEDHKRDLPWRKTSDPYRVWLSEIMLQQTRVSQGLSYYEKFSKRFTSIRDLAEADDDAVMKLWEGLGYYSRARNMLHAARQVQNDMGGEFPSTYTEIKKLKGVGDYTAAAIASIAFGEAYAVVDGNVYRVLSRFLGIDTAINSSGGKKEFAAAAEMMLDQDDPATYNQAIMEFGALQCVPKSPDCEKCVLKDRCMAYGRGRVGELPVKNRVKYDRQRYFHYLLLNRSGHLIIERREDSDIWRQLYQFPLHEGPEPLEMEELIEVFKLPADFKIIEYSFLSPHKLSHQTIHVRILKLQVPENEVVELREGQQWVMYSELDELAFPRPLRQYLDQNQLTLPFGFWA